MLNASASATEDLNSNNRLKYKLFIAVFILILVMPLACSFLTADLNQAYIQQVEKRNPHSFPKFITNNQINTHFSTDFEKWIQDKIVFRGNAISFYNNLFQPTSTKVLYGQDGYLFYKLDNAINNYKRKILLSDQDISRKLSEIIKIAQDLKSKNIKFYWVIAPDKHTIYPEYFPKNIKRTDNQSVLDQILAYVDKNNLQEILNIVDLRTDLLAKKSEFEQLYYKTDTHWNSIGAFVGHNQLMTKILNDDSPSKSLKSSKPAHSSKLTKSTELIKIDDYTISQSQMNGDLADMLARELKSNEYEFKPKFTKSIVKDTIDKDHFITTNNNPIINKTAMIYRDSFFIALQPFVSNYFSKATFITDRIRPQNVDEILQAKADIVIYEIVERKL